MDVSAELDATLTRLAEAHGVSKAEILRRAIALMEANVAERRCRPRVQETDCCDCPGPYHLANCPGA